MQDMLLDNISIALTRICSQNRIKRVDKLWVEVASDIHINEEKLRQHLLAYNSSLVGEDIELEIERRKMEGPTALIHSIRGEQMGV